MLYLRDTLLVLSSEQDGPCNATGILALQEEGFGLAILESEDLAITTDVELALHTILSALRFFSRSNTPIPCYEPVQSLLATLSSRAEEVCTFPG